MALILLPLCLSGATNDLTSALQKGLFEEEANHNLDAAAQAYQAVSARFDQDRKLAATAIFRLGEVYRKQGKTNEATAQYERIVREFEDQNTLVTLSRQNLTGLGTARGSPTSVSADAIAAAKAEAASLRAQIEELKSLSPEKRRIAVQQSFPNPYLTSLMQDLSRAEQKLVGIQKDLGHENPEVLKTKAVLDTINKQINTQLEGVLLGLEMKMKAAQQAAQASQAASAKSASDSGSDALATTDDEEKEIRRIQDMIKNSPDLINAPDNNDGTTPLLRAARNGQLVVAEYLLDHGADVNGYNRGRSSNPLFAAVGNGHKAMVELLVNRGADINGRATDGLTPLHEAAVRGYTSVAEVLLTHKANVNARSNRGETPLHRAAAVGNTAMIKLLLSKGAVVDAPDAHGSTALSMAAWAAQLDSVKVLLAAKANPNGGTSSSLLREVVRTPEIVELLLEAGAKPNMKRADGQTPLLEAVQAGPVESAALLIKHGADVNGTNEIGMTPLQMAVWAESIPKVSMLLTNHANVNVLGPAGRTALKMAEEAEVNGRPSIPGIHNGPTLPANKLVAREIADLLRQHGAKDEPPDKP